MDSTLRTVLVGLGDIGLRAHLPALSAHDRVRLTGVVDPDPDRRRRARALVDGEVTTFDTLGAALDHGEVDAVVLATPPWITPELVVASLRRGLWVLAEKPIATSLEAAAPIVQLAATDIRRLQVGLTFRHHPALLRLREWITSGLLGEGPFLIRGHIYDEKSDPRNPEHRQRLTATLQHGSPVMHEGSHVFDWLAFLLGTQGEVQDGWALRTDPGLPAENLVGGRLTYPNNTVAVVEFGWLTDGLPRCELSIHGQVGVATLDLANFRLERRYGDAVEVVEFDGDRTELAFARQLDCFVDGALNDRLLVPSLGDAVQALQTCVALELRARWTTQVGQRMSA